MNAKPEDKSQDISGLGLPEGYRVRAPLTADAQGIADLINACDQSEAGEPDTDLESVYRDWNDTGFDLEKDAWVVTAQDGQLVGYEIITDMLDDGRAFTDGYVHPQHRGHGIGTYLLRRAERRVYERIAEVPSGVRVTLEATCYHVDHAALQLFTTEGYQPIRYFWRMEINMTNRTEAPTVPQLPDGIALRTMLPDQDEYAVYNVVENAFQDHWGYHPRTFEEWQDDAPTDFDPTLRFLAVHGSEVVGVALCSLRREDRGFIRTVAVLRAWRGKGIASALLQQAFGEFYRRGKYRVGLGVDSQNPTGATRVYERAGMRLALQYDIYAKELRSDATTRRIVLQR